MPTTTAVNAPTSPVVTSSSTTGNIESTLAVFEDADTTEETSVTATTKSHTGWSYKKSTKTLYKKFWLDKTANFWDLKIKMMDRTTILLRFSNCRHIAY
jgi:hypothetical protein